MQIFTLAGSTWQFRNVTERGAWKAAVVPGCVHRDLLRLKLIPDPFWGANENGLQWIEERVWEYRRTFNVPRGFQDEEFVELVADGLDTVATVSLNGQEIARTENMFLGYRWDVKSMLRPGKNELVVRFDSAMDYIRTHRTDHHPKEFNDPVGRSQVIRKEQCQFGWDWGPRFVTAGVWQDCRLEAWSGNRLEHIRVSQDHRSDGSVRLQLRAELVRPDETVTLAWKLTLKGVVVAEGSGAEIIVDRPQLWWPNGHGAQPLYRLTVDVSSNSGTPIGSWRKTIGLRTIELDRHADQWGESFQFKVNGRALFAKGANWIPAHSFVAGLTRAEYERDLLSAARANMNMIRVWGGGIYETEDFYDVCDEQGLLVWQDFMFACARYPADEAFLSSVKAEATYQVRRLRHRASLALWAGNNEIWALNVTEIEADQKFRAEYEAIFHQTLPQVVAAEDAVTPYWPSSPWRGDREHAHTAGEARGDTHFWDVWHSRMPVKDYEKYAFRFVSEFGMQSYSSPETNATFAPTSDNNVFGATMENHQKNRGGNQVILDYVSRRYRFPKGQDELIYLSQLNQAYCMQTGIEHWRRNMPRSMGTLYWQLNDCWPVASWSSIEFTGRWRALQHIARRIFAPALVTAYVPGDETTIIGNYRRTTVQEVHLYTVYDAPETSRGVLRWDLFHLDGRKLKSGLKKVSLVYGESVRQLTLDAAPWLEKYGRDSIYLRIALDGPSGTRLSEETVFLTPPRFLLLPKARTKVDVKVTSSTTATLSFTSTAFQHRFAFSVPGEATRVSDNFFELYPNETKTVTVELARKMSAAQLKRALTYRSLVDTY
ncbi:MAG: glycoside hydrolase family 2 protein [Opitutus sp.]